MSNRGRGNFKGAFKRATQEYKYFACKNWSLKEVGEFWDSVTDYDDINESIYSYYRRFTNSWNLSKDFVKDNMVMLDFQARTGKGTEFWFNKGVIRKSYLVDFSDYLLNIANERLKGNSYDYELIKTLEYKLPFEDNFFDLIATYETIEHICNVNLFMNELSRVLKQDGIIILTCPNILWEPVHWIAAILNIHHSEGPHNFLTRKKLLHLFKTNDLKVMKENTTVILPFNNNRLITLNEKLEMALHSRIVRLIGLRRTFLISKSTYPI